MQTCRLKMDNLEACHHLHGTKNERGRNATASRTEEARKDELLRFGADHQYTVKPAVSKKDRLTCWHLVYKEYMMCGYVQPEASELRYTLHDALPDAATFLVLCNGVPAATISVYPDSPLGLPAEQAYPEEIGARRESGRKLAEVGRLAIAAEFRRDSELLARTIEMPFIYARRVQQATHVVITVNPSHQRYYERMMVFQSIGQQRDLSSVCDAPAVLLELDLQFQRDLTDWIHGEGPAPAASAHIGRTLYRRCSKSGDEIRLATGMRRLCMPLSPDVLRRYFVDSQPLFQSLVEPAIGFFEKAYPKVDFADLRKPNPRSRRGGLLKSLFASRF